MKVLLILAFFCGSLARADLKEIDLVVSAAMRIHSEKQNEYLSQLASGELPTGEAPPELDAASIVEFLQNEKAGLSAEDQQTVDARIMQINRYKALNDEIDKDCHIDASCERNSVEINCSAYSNPDQVQRCNSDNQDLVEASQRLYDTCLEEYSERLHRLKLIGYSTIQSFKGFDECLKRSPFLGNIQDALNAANETPDDQETDRIYRQLAVETHRRGVEINVFAKIRLDHHYNNDAESFDCGAYGSQNRQYVSAGFISRCQQFKENIEQQDGSANSEETAGRLEAFKDNRFALNNIQRDLEREVRTSGGDGELTLDQIQNDNRFRNQTCNDTIDTTIQAFPMPEFAERMYNQINESETLKETNAIRDNERLFSDKITRNNVDSFTQNLEAINRKHFRGLRKALKTSSIRDGEYHQTGSEALLEAYKINPAAFMHNLMTSEKQMPEGGFCQLIQEYEQYQTDLEETAETIGTVLDAISLATFAIPIAGGAAGLAFKLTRQALIRNSLSARSLSQARSALSRGTSRAFAFEGTLANTGLYLGYTNQAANAVADLSTIEDLQMYEITGLATAEVQRRLDEARASLVSTGGTTMAGLGIVRATPFVVNGVRRFYSNFRTAQIREDAANNRGPIAALTGLSRDPALGVRAPSAIGANDPVPENTLAVISILRRRHDQGPTGFSPIAFTPTPGNLNSLRFELANTRRTNEQIFGRSFQARYSVAPPDDYRSNVLTYNGAGRSLTNAMTNAEEFPEQHRLIQEYLEKIRRDADFAFPVLRRDGSLNVLQGDRYTTPSYEQYVFQYVYDRLLEIPHTGTRQGRPYWDPDTIVQVFREASDMSTAILLSSQKHFSSYAARYGGRVAATRLYTMENGETVEMPTEFVLPADTHTPGDVADPTQFSGAIAEEYLSRPREELLRIAKGEGNPPPTLRERSLALNALSQMCTTEGAQ